MVAGQQHAAAGKVDSSAFEVHREVGLDGCEAEGVAEAGVSGFALWVDVFEASDRVDTVAAHQQVGSGGATVFKSKSYVLGRLFDLGCSLSAGEGDVLVLFYSSQDAFQSISTGDAEGFVGRVADAFAFWAAEVGGGEAGGVDIEDFQVVDCAAVVSLADDWECSQVVEKSQGIGCEIDSAADSCWYGTNLKDADSRDLVFGSVSMVCKSR